VKESVEDPRRSAALERYVVINAIDHHWQEHLTEMEDLRESHRPAQLRPEGPARPNTRARPTASSRS
jgi:preprotein translocase subunit SecA